MRHFVVFWVLILLLNPFKLFSQTDDEYFMIFYNDFKTAVLNQEKSKIESYTTWSQENGGFFSSASKSSFMDKVYTTLFKDFWSTAFNSAELNQTIPTMYSNIILGKVEPAYYGYNIGDVVYALNNCDNALIFIKNDNKFKLIAMFYTGGGD